MPGLDGTGPMGEGPMTGGGFGYCVSENMPRYGGYGRGFARFGRGGGRGYGRGFGRGFGRGYGRGWGRAAAFGRAVPYPAYQQQIRPEDEMSMLKEDAGYLKQELSHIESRISELEGKQPE